MNAIKSPSTKDYEVRNVNTIEEIIAASNIEASQVSPECIKELKDRMLAEFRNKDQIIVGYKRKATIKNRARKDNKLLKTIQRIWR